MTAVAASASVAHPETPSKIAKLGAALTALKASLAADSIDVPVLRPEDLERGYQGVQLGALARLVDAPALALLDVVTTPGGRTVRRFVVEGVDATAKQVAARQLLRHEPTPKGAHDLQEIITNKDGLPAEILVRDHEDVVYRVVGREADADEQLTTWVREARAQSAARSSAGAALLEHPLVIADPVALSGAIAGAMRAVADLHGRQKAAAGVIDQLMKLTGAAGAAAAIEAAPAEALRPALLDLLGAASRLDGDLATIQWSLSGALQLLQQAEPLPHLPSPLAVRRE